MARQICCHKTDHRPLYACQHFTEIETGLVPEIFYINNKPFIKDGRLFIQKQFVEKCGNLMHADCIEKYGKCHKNSGVRQCQSQT